MEAKEMNEEVTNPNILSKEEYMRQKNEWPVPVVHLSFCDVVIGPLNFKDIIPLYDIMGIEFEDIGSDDIEGNPDLKDKVMKTPEIPTRKAIEYADLIWEYYACSMTRKPKIHPTPRDDNGNLLYRSKNPDLWYFDDLYDPDKQKLIQMAQSGDWGTMQGKFLSQEPNNHGPGQKKPELREITK